MMKNKLKFVLSAIFIFILSGCVPISSSPNARFYNLYAVGDNVNSKFEAKDLIIGIGPVKIPEYLNRPQMVITNKDKTVTFAQFNRWAEPLDSALERVINEDLLTRLDGATIETFPWNRTVQVKYQVIADVVRLENEFNEKLIFVVQWSIIDLEKKSAVFTKRSEFNQEINPHDYHGLASALSKSGALLSQEIAQQFNAIRVNSQSDKGVSK
ncbi:MAG: PqiC family protein [Candidatus Omnitrophota bacterium]